MRWYGESFKVVIKKVEIVIGGMMWIKIEDKLLFFFWIGCGIG